MSKHTEGPWHHLSGGNVTLSVLSDWAHPSNMIARCTLRPEKSEMEANARLIAAAPELLELAENFFEWHANHFDDFDDEVNGQLLCLSNDAEAIITRIEE